MPHAQVTVFIPATFNVEMTEAAFLDLTFDEREDLAFAALGKYPQVDLRNASFDIADLSVVDLNEGED